MPQVGEVYRVMADREDSPGCYYLDVFRIDEVFPTGINATLLSGVNGSAKNYINTVFPFSMKVMEDFKWKLQSQKLTKEAIGHMIVGRLCKK